MATAAHFLLSSFMLLATCLTIVRAELNFNNDLENNKNFKSIPTTIKTFENDTVLLPCYHNSSFRYVRWHRDDVPLVDSRHPETPPPDRIHLWSNGSLQVSNVQPEDTGDYYCEMMGNLTHAVQVHAIEVQYSPTVKAEPEGVIELPVGAIFEVVCEAKGVPQPAIIWRHNGNIVDKYHVGNRQKHQIDIKTRQLSGLIECVATNGVGEPAVAGVYLNVLYPPEIQTSQSKVYTKINMRTQLDCIVEAAPQASVHWFHHGVPVALDKRLTRHDIELQTERYPIQNGTIRKHTLVIDGVRDSDLGLYECRAENKIGYGNINIELTGRPMPCIFKINPGVQSSTSHVLIWQTESLSPIMEFKLKFRQIPSGSVTPQNPISRPEWTILTIPSEFSEAPIHTTMYTLRGLQPASVYEVAALARNHFGWSESSKIVRFATGGEVELPNYSTESMENQYNDIDEEVIQEHAHNDLSADASMADSITSISTTFWSVRTIELLVLVMAVVRF